MEGEEDRQSDEVGDRDSKGEAELEAVGQKEVLPVGDTVWLRDMVGVDDRQRVAVGDRDSEGEAELEVERQREGVSVELLQMLGEGDELVEAEEQGVAESPPAAKGLMVPTGSILGARRWASGAPPASSSRLPRGTLLGEAAALAGRLGGLPLPPATTPAAEEA